MLDCHELVKRLLSEGVGFESQRSTKSVQKPFWIFLGHIISSVHPTRRNRVISSWSNREIVTARGCVKSLEFGCTLAGKARTKAGNDPYIPYLNFRKL